MPDSNRPQRGNIAQLLRVIALGHANPKHLLGLDDLFLGSDDYGQNQFRNTRWGPDLKIEDSDDLVRYIDGFLESPETVGYYNPNDGSSRFYNEYLTKFNMD